VIDLKKFCYQYEDFPERFRQIGNPWSRHEYTFATDRKIIVRVPRIMGTHDNRMAPDALNLPWNDRPTLSADIPDLPESIMEICKFCEGEPVICEKPRFVCDDCHGTGIQEVLQDIEVAGTWYNSKYLRIIKDLPDYEFFPVSIAGLTPDQMRGKASHFTFDGGEGLLMPILR